MLILFFCYFLPIISGIEYRTSTTVKDNKIYTIFQDRDLNHIKSKVYELEEGPAINIAYSEKTFKLFHFLKGYKLEFIDVLDNSLDSHNRLWVSAQLDRGVKEQRNYSYRNWMGYIKLDDMTLKTDSSIIKFPTHENFPIDGYTTNRVTNEFGSALYVAGGGLYSKKDNKYSTGNSFFKYNFTTKEWVDMSYSTSGKLKPMIGHKSAVIGNRYLIILGGYVERSIDSSERLNGSRSIFEYYSLYNLTIFDTFTNNLNSVNIKPDLFDTSIATFQFDKFLTTVYNNKIVVLGGYVGEDDSTSMGSNSYLGILDYSSRTWAWNEIHADSSNSFYYDTLGSDLLVYNNQLIILTAYPQANSIHVYDMISHKISYKLRLSDKTMPTYAIVLMAVICAALLLLFIYLLYRKYKNKPKSKNGNIKYNGPIREVWSNPDIDNTLNIIMLDKKRSLAIRKNNSNKLDSNIQNPNTANSHKSDIIEFSK